MSSCTGNKEGRISPDDDSVTVIEDDRESSPDLEIISVETARTKSSSVNKASKPKQSTPLILGTVQTKAPMIANNQQMRLTLNPTTGGLELHPISGVGQPIILPGGVNNPPGGQLLIQGNAPGQAPPRFVIQAPASSTSQAGPLLIPTPVSSQGQTSQPQLVINPTSSSLAFSQKPPQNVINVAPTISAQSQPLLIGGNKIIKQTNQLKVVTKIDGSHNFQRIVKPIAAATNIGTNFAPVVTTAAAAAAANVAANRSDPLEDLQGLTYDDLLKVDSAEQQKSPQTTNVLAGLLDKNVLKNLEHLTEEQKQTYVAQQIKKANPELANVCPQFIARIQSAAGALNVLTDGGVALPLALQNHLSSSPQVKPVLTYVKPAPVPVPVRPPPEVKIPASNSKAKYTKPATPAVFPVQQPQQNIRKVKPVSFIRKKPPRPVQGNDHADFDVTEFITELVPEKNQGKGKPRLLLGSQTIRPAQLPQLQQVVAVQAAPTKTTTSSTSDCILIDSDSDKTDVDLEDLSVEIGATSRGKPSLKVRGYTYYQNRKFNDTVYWLCCEARDIRCKGKVTTKNYRIIKLYENHNHPREDGTACVPVVVSKCPPADSKSYGKRKYDLSSPSMSPNSKKARSKEHLSLFDHPEFEEDHCILQAHEINPDDSDSDIPDLSGFSTPSPLTSTRTSVDMQSMSSIGQLHSPSYAMLSPVHLSSGASSSCPSHYSSRVPSPCPDYVAEEIEKGGVREMTPVKELVEQYHEWYQKASSSSSTQPITIKPDDAAPSPVSSDLGRLSPSLYNPDITIPDVAWSASLPKFDGLGPRDKNDNNSATDDNGGDSNVQVPNEKLSTNADPTTKQLESVAQKLAEVQTTEGEKENAAAVSKPITDGNLVVANALKAALAAAAAKAGRGSENPLASESNSNPLGGQGNVPNDVHVDGSRRSSTNSSVTMIKTEPPTEGYGYSPLMTAAEIRVELAKINSMTSSKEKLIAQQRLQRKFQHERRKICNDFMAPVVRNSDLLNAKKIKVEDEHRVKHPLTLIKSGDHPPVVKRFIQRIKFVKEPMDAPDESEPTPNRVSAGSFADFMKNRMAAKASVPGPQSSKNINDPSKAFTPPPRKIRLPKQNVDADFVYIVTDEMPDIVPLGTKRKLVPEIRVKRIDKNVPQLTRSKNVRTFVGPTIEDILANRNDPLLVRPPKPRAPFIRTPNRLKMRNVDSTQIVNYPPGPHSSKTSTALLAGSALGAKTQDKSIQAAFVEVKQEKKETCTIAIQTDPFRIVVPPCKECTARKRAAAAAKRNMATNSSATPGPVNGIDVKTESDRNI